MTPATASSPYLSAAQLLRLVDWRVVADLASDGEPENPRPTRRALLDDATEAGAVVADHMLAASGEFEQALTAGDRYRVADVQALAASTAGGMYVRRLVASLTHWSLAQRMQPAAADPDLIPGAAAALAVLEQLRTGERVLPFAEAQAAGGGPTAVANYDPLTEPGGSRTVTRAGRMFDTRETTGG